MAQAQAVARAVASLISEYAGEKERASYEKVAAKEPPGEGGRFDALEKSLRSRGDVDNPRAVAAAIGRKKYGKKKMARMATRGRAEAVARALSAQIREQGGWIPPRERLRDLPSGTKRRAPQMPGASAEDIRHAEEAAKAARALATLLTKGARDGKWLGLDDALKTVNQHVKEIGVSRNMH